MGEGERDYQIVSSALGGGADGLDPTCTTTTGAVGRYFLLPDAPLIENRTTIYRNEIPLTVSQGPITGYVFDGNTQVRVDNTTGCIALAPSVYVDQGGQFYSSAANNVGDGAIDGLGTAPLDPNAPAETWTVRCSSVRRDGYGNPVDGYARFIANGTVSGFILDGYGNQITWQSNGVSENNGILQFSIAEGTTPFETGDSFVIRTRGGSLLRGDSLRAAYIAEIDINDPVFFTNINEFQAKHGRVSLANTLALGAQIMMSNNPPGFWAVQCAPPLPRRINYTLVTAANGQADIEELEFALPQNIVPDESTNINFFVTSFASGETTQIIPNKVPFFNPAYTPQEGGMPEDFVFGPDEFSYTVILDDLVVDEATNGTLIVTGAATATLSTPSVNFTLGDATSATRKIQIINSSPNDSLSAIGPVVDGVATLTLETGAFGAVGTYTSVQFRLIDEAVQSATILWTDDLALAFGDDLVAGVVDQGDADFFDAGWVQAYESLEKIDTQIVVPLPSQTISAIFQNGKIHVETMSTIKNKHERLLFIGAIKGLTPDNVIGTKLAAVEDIGILEGIQGDDIAEILVGDNEDLANYGIQDNYGNTFRVMYFYPDEIVVQIGADRAKVDGFYMAPAAAGFFSANPNINVPLTNKGMAGFTILRDRLYPPITLENLAAAGAAVVQPIAGGGRCLWGRTTTGSGFPSEEEASVVFIRDRIALVMRLGFKQFIGLAEDETFPSTLYARAVGILTALQQRRLITDFRSLTVARNTIEPRQWDIAVQVQPVFPVNWIYIRVDVGIL